MTKKLKSSKLAEYSLLLIISNITIILGLILFVPSSIDIVLIPVLLFFSIFSWRVLFTLKRLPLITTITHSLIALGLLVSITAVLGGYTLYHATLSPFISMALIGLCVTSIIVFIQAKKPVSLKSRKSK